MLRFFFITFVCYLYATINFFANAEVIKKIDISGNEHTAEKIVLTSLNLKEGQNVSQNDLNTALKRLYSTGSFADASINISNGVVKVDVVESPIVSGIYLTGNSQLSIDDIKKELSSKELQIYSKNKVKFDIDRLYGFYQKMGYLNIKIEPKVVFLENNAVDLIFDINEGTPSYIKEINIFGNTHISSTKIKENLVSQERGLLNFSDAKGRFEEDNIEKDKQIIKMLYQNEGYARADVVNYSAGLDKENYNFTINYFVEEGKKYNFKDVDLLCEMPSIKNDEELKKKISIKDGQKFSIEELQKSLFEINRYLNAKGYANIKPTYNLDIDDEKNIVNVEFVLNITQKVYVNKITISGNKTTRENVILRELVIHEGDLYNSDLIAESRDRLYMLGYFKIVDIKEHFIPNTDLVNLEIVLEEQFFGSVNFSIGYNNYYGIVGTATLQINNLFGYGFSSGFTFERNGFIETYSLNFYDPYLIERKKIGFGLNAFFSRFGNLGGGTQYTSYTLSQGHSYGLTGTFGFEIINRLNLSIILEYLQYNQSLRAGSGYTLYEQTIGDRTTISIGYNLSWNKANRARYSNKGFIINVGQKIGGFGFIGTQNFLKSTINFVGNLQLIGEDLILHAEASGGNVMNLTNDKQIGVEHMFSLGGGQQMRGFNYFGIGPRVRKSNITTGAYSDLYYAIQGMNYYFASLELRTPIFLPKDYGFFFSAFVDAGATFGFEGTKTYQSGDIKEEVLDSAMIRVSVGGGITWQSPMGEIGLYYAKPIVKQAYDTTLEFGVKFGTQL